MEASSSSSTPTQNLSSSTHQLGTSPSESPPQYVYPFTGSYPVPPNYPMMTYHIDPTAAGQYPAHFGYVGWFPPNFVPSADAVAFHPPFPMPVQQKIPLDDLNDDVRQRLDNAPVERTNLYVRGLPSDTDDERLLALCQQFGAIVSVKAILEQTDDETRGPFHFNGPCKGYGFALCESKDDATKVMTGLGQLGYEVSFAKESFSTRLKKLQDENTTNLYISNIPPFMDESAIFFLLAKYGEVSSIRLLRDNNGISRGVGFVRFATRQQSDMAIQGLDKIVIAGATKGLRIRYADNQSQKKLKVTTAKKREVYTNHHSKNGSSSGQSSESDNINGPPANSW